MNRYVDGVLVNNPPSGAAGGDLSGTYPSPTVAGLQGRDIAVAAPADTNVLAWNAATSQWEPAVAGGGGTPSVKFTTTNNQAVDTVIPIADQTTVALIVTAVAKATIRTAEPIIPVDTGGFSQQSRMIVRRSAGGPATAVNNGGALFDVFSANDFGFIFQLFTSGNDVVARSTGVNDWYAEWTLVIEAVSSAP